MSTSTKLAPTKLRQEAIQHSISVLSVFFILANEKKIDKKIGGIFLQDIYSINKKKGGGWYIRKSKREKTGWSFLTKENRMTGFLVASRPVQLFSTTDRNRLACFSFSTTNDSPILNIICQSMDSQLLTSLPSILNNSRMTHILSRVDRVQLNQLTKTQTFILDGFKFLFMHCFMMRRMMCLIIGWHLHR